MLEISCELSAKQTIHMKCHTLFLPEKKYLRMVSVGNDTLKVIAIFTINALDSLAQTLKSVQVLGLAG